MMKTWHTPTSSRIAGTVYLVFGLAVALAGWLRVTASYRDMFETDQLQVLVSIVLFGTVTASIVLFHRAYALLHNSLSFGVIALSAATASSLVLLQWAYCFDEPWYEAVVTMVESYS